MCKKRHRLSVCPSALPPLQKRLPMLSKRCGPPSIPIIICDKTSPRHKEVPIMPSPEVSISQTKTGSGGGKKDCSVWGGLACLKVTSLKYLKIIAKTPKKLVSAFLPKTPEHCFINPILYQNSKGHCTSSSCQLLLCQSLKIYIPGILLHSCFILFLFFRNVIVSFSGMLAKCICGIK